MVRRLNNLITIPDNISCDGARAKIEELDNVELVVDENETYPVHCTSGCYTKMLSIHEYVFLCPVCEIYQVLGGEEATVLQYTYRNQCNINISVGDM